MIRYSAIRRPLQWLIPAITHPFIPSHYAATSPMVLRKCTGLNWTTVHGSWIMDHIPAGNVSGLSNSPTFVADGYSKASSSSPPHLFASTILHGVVSMLLKRCTTHTSPAKVASDNGVLTTLVRGPRSDAPITLQPQHGCGSLLPKLGRDR